MFKYMDIELIVTHKHYRRINQIQTKSRTTAISVDVKKMTKIFMQFFFFGPIIIYYSSPMSTQIQI